MFLAFLACLLPADMAAAADQAQLSALVQQLGADDFDAKVKSLGALAASTDPRVGKILKSLEDGEFYVTEDKNVVRAEADGDNLNLFDPLSGGGRCRSDHRQ
ncbi:MAG TPA: hypothetical protein VIJ42_12165 [Stellaceae bacterium]